MGVPRPEEAAIAGISLRLQPLISNKIVLRLFIPLWLDGIEVRGALGAPSPPRYSRIMQIRRLAYQITAQQELSTPPGQVFIGLSVGKGGSVRGNGIPWYSLVFPLCVLLHD